MPSFTSQWDTQPSTGFMLLKIALVSTSTESAASRASHTHSMGKVKNRRVSGRMVKFGFHRQVKALKSYGFGAVSQRKAAAREIVWR